MKRLFNSAKAMLDEITLMKTAERLRQEDRAIVSAFYNGSPPLTDAEAAALGFTINTNNLFGYTQISDAKDQLFALFHKPASLLSVECDAAPPGKRVDWGSWAQTEATRVLKKIVAFKPAYEGVSGDAAMHGEGMFFFPNTTFPTPRQCPLSRLYVPDDAPADPSELTHFAIDCPLSLREIHRYWERSAKGWKIDALRQILNKIYDNELRDGTTLDYTNVEEIEYRRQQNSGSGSSTRRRPGVDAWYFYQQRCDLPGTPWDVTIISKDGANTNDKDVIDNSILYDGEEAYPTILDCLHPLFMDCIIGGAPSWHRVLGLGHLNYQSNHAVELLICRAQQATLEGSMNLWKVTNTATRDAVEQILLKHNGVIPEGMELMQNRFAPNFGGILEMIQFFRQKGSENARGTSTNVGDKNDQLEVQAVAEQNKGASRSNSRTSNWYDYLDRMFGKVFARLCNPYIDVDEPGYSEVMDFQNAMRRRGVDMRYLQESNVQVRAVRIVGDGLRSKELGQAQWLTNNRELFAPEVQPRITRMVAGIVLDNYPLAEELTPMDQEPQTPALDPKVENSIMLDQLVPLPPHAADIDDLHVTSHFPSLEMLIRKAVQYQKAAFEPDQAEAFRMIGGHTMAHIDRIESKAQNNRHDPARERARAYRDQLNQYAAMAEKLLNNMQQQQQGQQQEMSPVEMADLQLKIKALELQRDKLTFNAEKFTRTQGFREQSHAFDQMLKLQDATRQDTNSRRDFALRDVETATKVAVANKPDRTKNE
jgi:hypothetical protein